MELLFYLRTMTFSCYYFQEDFVTNMVCVTSEIKKKMYF